MTIVLTKNFTLDGEELQLDQAEVIKKQGVQMIQAQAGPFQVDLGGLQKANSVTVAVLVAWYRSATLTQKSIMFVNLSQDLRNIIEFSGLSRVLLPAESPAPTE